MAPSGGVGFAGAEGARLGTGVFVDVAVAVAVRDVLPPGALVGVFVGRVVGVFVRVGVAVRDGPAVGVVVMVRVGVGCGCGPESFLTSTK